MNNYKNTYRELKGRKNVTGSNINYYRNQKELSAQQLSDKLIMKELDLHRQAIYAIEAGKRSVSDYELCIIAEELGVTADILLKDFSEQIKNENK